MYGLHQMSNIVTREKGYPAAVLIMGIEGVSGPGRLTKALHVNRKLNGLSVNKSSGLWIEDRGTHISTKDIKRKERVGVAHAGDVWAKEKWRYVISRKMP